ncbi:peptidyl-prolyl cis-trans isomerase FKBP17-1, chloroplastic-like isoform X3 [Chenopodium quinoa]|uniref:peptidyl-prolyl cis-trans isomerase FKBP17-1, chloroplastic-like isoform X3 n=1 Tax=Chenopodium quinoa TaxID=63459 RepID=UPI000B774724|nr:peptidyl-prolyl cis-trans isomerase FKBP17-1, chloroplastic-like isoform X3 [Chenopodium quinoa]
MTMISFHVPHHLTIYSSALSQQSKKISIISSSSSPLVKQPTSSSRRLLLSTCIITSIISPATFFSFSAASFSSTPNNSSDAIGKFYELPNSGGVKALDLRVGTGSIPVNGDKVISGIEGTVRSMKVGGIRRVIIPPSQGYQNTTQEPLPPNFFDRQRLFTTIFNPTRLANGEGSTLGTLIFDVELVNVKH